jgi:hypothetical protein
LLFWRVWKLLNCRAPRCQLHYAPLAWCWLYVGSCHVSVGWLQAEYMLLSKGCWRVCVQGVCWPWRLLMHNAGEVCVTWRCQVSVCVGERTNKQKTNKNFLGRYG